MEVATSVMNQLRAVDDGRSVLRGLREMVALAGTGNQADVSRLANAGAPEQLLRALDRHVGNPEIQKIGLAALAVLVGGRPAVATWVVGLGALDTIRTSARSFESDTALSLGVSQALLAVASTHTAPGAAPAMGASLGEPHRARAADILLGVLERHPCDLAVALSACRALCHVVTSDDAVRTTAATLAALYVHRRDVLMCRVCCRLIHILCAASQSSRSHVLATTATEDIAAIIQRHPSRLEVVTEACAALERLGSSAAQECDGDPSGPSGASVATLFFRVGVYPAVLRAMHRHSHFASLTSSGCNILSLCADADQNAKDRIMPGERGAAAAVVSALIRHSSGVHDTSTEEPATICTQAAQAVAALALNSTLAQATLGDAGAVDALLLALRVHRDRSTVLCRVVVVALSALCSDCASNIQRLHEQEGVEQVVRAARYTGDPGLGVAMCRAVAVWCEPGADVSSGDWRCSPAGSAALTLACTMMQVSVARGANGVGTLPEQLAAAMSRITEPKPEPQSEPQPEPELENEHEHEPALDEHERTERQATFANSDSYASMQLTDTEFQASHKEQPEHAVGHLQHLEKRYSEMACQTVDACCRALECLLQLESLRLLALAQGVVQLCIAALKVHANKTAICVSVCRTVVSALGDRDQQTQKCLREEGGLQELVSQLRVGEYVIEPRLDSASLRALLAATSGSSSPVATTQHGINCRAILRLGAAKILYRVLIVEARGGVERCAQLSLKLVVNLALEAEPDEIHDMNDAGLTFAIYHAMQRHATSGRVLGLAARALVCLCHDLYETEEQPEAQLLSRNAALQFLREALPRYLDDRRLQKYGKQVLNAESTAPERILSEAEPPEPEPHVAEPEAETTLKSELRQHSEPSESMQSETQAAEAESMNAPSNVEQRKQLESEPSDTQAMPQQSVPELPETTPEQLEVVS